MRYTDGSLLPHTNRLLLSYDFLCNNNVEYRNGYRADGGAFDILHSVDFGQKTLLDHLQLSYPLDINTLVPVEKCESFFTFKQDLFNKEVTLVSRSKRSAPTMSIEPL
jgi:hypothetical protein